MNIFKYVRFDPNLSVSTIQWLFKFVQIHKKLLFIFLFSIIKIEKYLYRNAKVISTIKTKYY